MITIYEYLEGIAYIDIGKLVTWMPIKHAFGKVKVEILKQKFNSIVILSDSKSSL